MEQHYPFTLPPLPYGYDALAPELIEKCCISITTSTSPPMWTL